MACHCCGICVRLFWIFCRITLQFLRYCCGSVGAQLWDCWRSRYSLSSLQRGSSCHTECELDGTVPRTENPRAPDGQASWHSYWTRGASSLHAMRPPACARRFLEQDNLHAYVTRPVLLVHLASSNLCISRLSLYAMMAAFPAAEHSIAKFWLVVQKTVSGEALMFFLLILGGHRRLTGIQCGSSNDMWNDRTIGHLLI